MNNISNILLDIMEQFHCDVMTALLILLSCKEE